MQLRSGKAGFRLSDEMKTPGLKTQLNKKAFGEAFRNAFLKPFQTGKEDKRKGFGY